MFSHSSAHPTTSGFDFDFNFNLLSERERELGGEGGGEGGKLCPPSSAVDCKGRATGGPRVRGGIIVVIVIIIIRK